MSENWEDVWIEYRISRHQQMYLGPCFESEKCVHESLSCEQQYLASGRCSYPDVAQEEIADYQAVLAGLANGYVYQPGSDNCSNVYIPGGKLTRQSVEAATRWLLTTHYGLSNIKLKWQR